MHQMVMIRITSTHIQCNKCHGFYTKEPNVEYKKIECLQSYLHEKKTMKFRAHNQCYIWKNATNYFDFPPITFEKFYCSCLSLSVSPHNMCM